MSKTRQAKGKRRGFHLTDEEMEMLALLAAKDNRTQSNMVGTLIRQEYERRGLGSP